MRSKVARILIWAATGITAAGIGAAGLAKFIAPHRWEALFQSWGYPASAASVIGAAEVIGALALLVPRASAYAALLLGLVMTGAIATLLAHREGPLGNGGTPAVYATLLIIVAIARWRDRYVRRGASDAHGAGGRALT